MKTVLSTIWRQGRRQIRADRASALSAAGLRPCPLVWTPHTLLDTDGFHAWASPRSAAHPLGTDGAGADVLSWLMAGSRTNLMIAVLTVVVAAAIGLLLVAGHGIAFRCARVHIGGRGRRADLSFRRCSIALILSVPFGASAAVVVAACGLRVRAESGAHRTTLRPCSPRVRPTSNRRYGPERAPAARVLSRISCRIRCRC